MRPSKAQRKTKRKAVRMKFAMFLNAVPFIIGGKRKTYSLPYYAKPRACDFPTTPVVVWRERLFMIEDKQVSISVKGKQIINPFRLPFGIVARSRNTPLAMAERDLKKHDKFLLVNGKPIHTISEDHKRQCVSIAR